MNFSRSILESGTLGALENEKGVKSDHKIAYTFAEFRREKDKIISYSYRYLSESGTRDFKQWLAQHNWAEVYQAATSGEKALIFHNHLQGAMDVFFPYKTTTRREKDPP